MGCLISEILLGEPIFKGKDSIDLFYSIVKILGSPTQDDCEDLYIPHVISEVQKIHIVSLFKYKVEYSLVEMIEGMLRFSPKRRISLATAMESKYFKEIK